MTAHAANQDIQKSYLGIEYLPGDEEPIHNDPVWQTLCKVSRKKGIRVYVKHLDSKLSVWGAAGLIINERVPNWYKSVLLAQIIILWELAKNHKFSKDKVDLDYWRKQIKASSKKFLYLEIQKELGAIPEELEQIESFVYGAALKEPVVERECSIDAVELFGGGV